MNFFNKTFLVISLTCCIALTNEAYSFKDLTKAINAKKKTIAASLVTAGVLSFAGLKAVDWFYSSWPKHLSKEQMLDLHPNLNAGILFAAERGFKEMSKTVNAMKISAIMAVLSLTHRLISKAHESNFFGENPKKEQTLNQ